MRLNFHEHEGQVQHLGSVAEWSKALVLGTSLSGRGFESHRCQTTDFAKQNLTQASLSHKGKKQCCGDEGDRTPGISNANRALYH